MKIIEDRKGSLKNKFLFSRFFGGLYYFFALHLSAVLIILGLALSIAILLFFAELLFPERVHIFNLSLSDRVFKELVHDHKYHSAIAFMELKDHKKDFIDSSDDPYEFRMELADCYVHTGDYPKALEQYRLLRKWFDRKFREELPENWTPDQVRRFRDFMNICFLKEEFRIYLKMGDITNVRNHYGEIKTIHENTDWENFGNLFDDEEEGEGSVSMLLGDHKFEDGFRLELIQGRYLSDPEGAVTEMEEYTKRTVDSEKFNPRYKLILLNELIRMLIGRNRQIEARRHLEVALRIVDFLEYNPVIFDQLGDLSEYAYRLNDREDGRCLLKKYLYQIDRTYDRSDIQYAVAHAMEFKYLDADGEEEELTRKVADASTVLRSQIARNFTGMTSAQREYFVDQFRPLLAYANRLMESRPNGNLAAVCFENNMFLRGLLLRSENSVGYSVKALGDSSLVRKYNRFVEASRELVMRGYVSGPGNYYRKQKLQKEIEVLETEIAGASLEFRREYESSDFSLERLRKSLSKDDIVMQIIEGEKSYFALLADKSGNVLYQPIGSKARVRELTGNPGEIYVNTEGVRELFGSVLPMVKGRNVFLSSSGIFSQIAFAALPIDDRRTVMGDLATIRIVGSPTEIPSIKSADKFNLLAGRTVLWGGVDYGAPSEAATDVSETRGLLRGDILGRLPNSLTEVNEIASMLKSHGAPTTVISGLSATEKSFTDRSGRNDYVLHVSTHGFFHDSCSFTNPMRNSGLLFANSQKYWSSERPLASVNESDGILRADEIAHLDLSGCRLVVLSACQTGLGEYNSEGVYGLQRAFKLAGAGCVLMTLWSVDDRATRELMTEFYSALISGKDPNEALVAAQRRLREKGYAPDHWAPFVLLN